ncbi:MAG TPA: PQQ-dependent sugar dehydrogenase [Rhizomicrobium sp.]|nr:PQQ-dependent sugar dehydrogenase [Rhizomicrobium sp.]
MRKQGLMISTFAAALLAAGVSFAADHPGQKFQISPTSLAKPHATKGVGNPPEDIPRAAGNQPEVPKGFVLSIFADRLANARWMAVAPNGDIFLAEPPGGYRARGGGKITVLRDSNNDGKADQRFTFLPASAGFVYPHGLAFHAGYLYVGDVRGIWRFSYTDGQTAAGKPEKVTSKVADLAPKNGHITRNIAFGPDGGLYLALGSRDNISDFKPGAQVFKINADGSMREFASGIRNPVGIAFQPGTNTLFVVSNERDMLGDGLPPDYMTSVKPGGFYGYPYAYIGKNPDPVWGAKDPGGKVASTITPDVLFQAHSAPVGLVFYTGSSFPAAYKNDAFVALHGSWNAANPTGYKVVRVRFQNGKPVNGYENFVTGFWNGTGQPGQPAKVWGRPAGLAVAKDGSLLIADDVANVIWRVAYTGK